MSSKILLVEDDAALGQMYQTLLSNHGYQVKLCSDGEQALSTAVEYGPDLILLDIMMPKLSGFDVLDILHNTPQTAYAKIIILTALGEPADRVKAMERGANDFLVKPETSTQDVLKRIEDVLAS